MVLWLTERWQAGRSLQDKLLLLLTILCSFWLPCLCISFSLFLLLSVCLSWPAAMSGTLDQLIEVPCGEEPVCLVSWLFRDSEMVVTLDVEALARLSQATPKRSRKRICEFQLASLRFLPCQIPHPHTWLWICVGSTAVGCVGLAVFTMKQSACSVIQGSTVCI